jgi:hypothetical protein
MSNGRTLKNGERRMNPAQIKKVDQHLEEHLKGVKPLSQVHKERFALVSSFIAVLMVTLTCIAEGDIQPLQEYENTALEWATKMKLKNPSVHCYVYSVGLSAKCSLSYDNEKQGRKVLTGYCFTKNPRAAGTDSKLGQCDFSD